MMPWIDPKKAIAAAKWERDTAKQRGDAVGVMIAESKIAQYEKALAA